MSLLLIESFGHGRTATKWTNGTWDIGTGGPNGAKTGSPSGYVKPYCDLVTPTDVLIVGFGFKGQVASDTFIEFVDSGTTQVCVRFDHAQNVFILMRGGTEVARTAAAFMPGIWYYIELKALIDPTAGTLELRINGASKATFSGNTRATGTSQITRVLGGNYSLYANWYICDDAGAVNNDFLGDCKVVCILPNGAGNSSQFTPSAGANYENVDDATPDDDTTYNAASVAGYKDTYAMGDVTITGTIKGVQALVLARKDDAGSRTARILCRSGAADYNGDTFSLLDSYVYNRKIWEADPATAAAWDEAGINAAEFGLELVS